MTDMTIEQVTPDRVPHYEPYGWHHWPEHPWLSYQFRRQLGETQEGAGTISECFLAASRMIPGDLESWHAEWKRVADHNRERAEAAWSRGHRMTARAAWLRAAGYYRSAEFWLAPDDPRRIQTFDLCERSMRSAGETFDPPWESVAIPYEHGVELAGYFARSPSAPDKQPVLIAFGGLDSFKDELYFMVGRAALERGISCLFVDGPGQGATLRRHGVPNRVDYEVPVGRCIDYLEQRDDVDLDRIALSGSSLGGYYAARAACYEHRIAAVVSHGAIWDLEVLWSEIDDDNALAGHMRWVFGADSIDAARQKWNQFKLHGHLQHMRCPYLIIHGGHDVLGVRGATQAFEHAREHGVDVTLEMLTEDETGAEHCQHDNPTLGMERIADWLVDRLGVGR